MASSEERNAEPMHALDDAWNAQDVDGSKSASTSSENPEGSKKEAA